MKKKPLLTDGDPRVGTTVRDVLDALIDGLSKADGIDGRSAAAHLVAQWIVTEYTD